MAEIVRDRSGYFTAHKTLINGEDLWVYRDYINKDFDLMVFAIGKIDENGNFKRTTTFALTKDEAIALEAFLDRELKWTPKI